MCVGGGGGGGGGGGACMTDRSVDCCLFKGLHYTCMLM